MMTSPPRPPSPPDGPPRGTNFSRRKATHPLPPSPALTRIRASSINIAIHFSVAPATNSGGTPQFLIHHHSGNPGANRAQHLPGNSPGEIRQIPSVDGVLALTPQQHHLIANSDRGNAGHIH